MNLRSTTLPVRTVLAGGLLALLAGCTTSTITGTTRLHSAPHTAPQANVREPTESAGSAVSSDQAELATAFTAARAVDPCALHNPAVAASVVAMPGDEIMPGRVLNSCDLDLSRSATALSSWRLSVTVGVLFDARQRQQAQQQTIADLTFYHPSSADDTGESCRYVLAFGGEETGIELRVRRDDDQGKSKTPCQIAQDYLRGVGKYWAHPALRTDKLTTPVLSISAGDPCAALGPVSAELGGPVRVSTSEPHSCSLIVGTPTNGSGMITGEYAVETDPRTLLSGASAKDYKSVTVADRPGVARETTSILKGASKTCSVTAIVDNQVVLQADKAKPDNAKTLQVVKASASDCALATKAAEALLAALH
jgi:hypothetical protein